MIITFSHYKGGTGKTTSCISVAGCLAKKGKKVLVVDIDPQSNATSGLGIDKKSIKKSMYNVLGRKRTIKSIILATEVENLHLAPASSELEKLYEISDKNGFDNESLKNSLALIKADYDFILIDTPPSYKKFIANGMVAADKIVVVLDPGIFALESLSILNDSFGNFFEDQGLSFDINMVIITKCKGMTLPWKKKQSKEVKNEVETMLGKEVFTIPYSDHIYETHAKGIPISHHKPRSNVGKAYNQIVNRILEDAYEVEIGEKE
jgi:chromosome partitioning protein